MVFASKYEGNKEKNNETVRKGPFLPSHRNNKWLILFIGFSSIGRASFLLWNLGINFLALILGQIMPCLCSKPTTFEAASVVSLTAHSTACV